MATISSALLLLYVSYMVFLVSLQSTTTSLRLTVQQAISLRQTLLVTPNRSHVLISAFYDDRQTGYGPSIRALGTGLYDDTQALYCKLYYSNGQTYCPDKPVMVETLGSMGKQSQVYANFYHCTLPVSGVQLSGVHVYTRQLYTTSNDGPSVSNSPIPRAVSFNTDKSCGFTSSAIQVEDIPDTTHAQIAVCIPQVTWSSEYTAPSSQDWVELLELCRILGAEFVHVYNSTQTWPAIRELTAYQKSGMLHVTSRPGLSGQQPEAEAMILRNDCVYRNLHKVKYLVMLQHNEILIPYQQKSWMDLIHHLAMLHNSSLVGAYVFRTVRYYDETTQTTSNFSLDIAGGVKARHHRLPRIVSHRLRDRSSLPISQHAQIAVELRKMTGISASGISTMLPGYLYYTVPEQHANIHQFNARGKLKIKDLTLDATTDKFVPSLLNAMHQKFYSIT